MPTVDSNWSKFKTFVKGPEKSFIFGNFSDFSSAIKQIKINTAQIKEAGATDF